MRQAKPGEKFARWIRVDGTEMMIAPDNGKQFTLDECYGLIKTNDSNTEPMLEIATIHSGKNKGRIILCEENGIDLDLPPNDTATMSLADSCVGSSDRGFRGDIVVCEYDMVE